MARTVPNYPASEIWCVIDFGDRVIIVPLKDSQPLIAACTGRVYHSGWAGRELRDCDHQDGDYWGVVDTYGHDITPPSVRFLHRDQVRAMFDKGASFCRKAEALRRGAVVLSATAPGNSPDQPF